MQHPLGSSAAGAPVKHVLISLAALLCIYSFWFPPAPPQTGPVAAAMRTASSADRAKVARIYRALGDITVRDSGQQIATTAVWRKLHASALRLAAGGTDLPGKYKGLDEAVEKVLSEHFSLDDVAITKELASKIDEGCKEVAKQSGG